MSKWKVEGDYFESCNCDSVCPCVFLSDPTNKFCDVVVAWHVEHGEFDGTKLDGLNTVAYFHTPGHMIKDGQWEAAVYIDSNAKKEQAEALQKIFTGQVGGHPSVLAPLISKVLGGKQAKIDYRADGKTRSMHIPEVADIQVEAVKGIDSSKETYISNAPLCISPQFPNYVAKSSKAVYTDYGRQLDNSGKNGFFAKFEYSG